MHTCLGFDVNVNRHLTHLETSESGQASEILPIESQDPNAPPVINILSLMRMKNISTETSLSEQTT
jgi:hypothetical protein